MKTSDMPKFSKLMMKISSVHSKPVSPHLIEMYWQALETFDFQSVEMALLAHIQNPDNGQFMPKPADVIRFLKGSYHTQALQAWSKVIQAIKQLGSYTSVVFDDPLIHAVSHKFQME
jgi:hypothetical protein